MSVVAGDLKAYQAANMPEDDTSTVGGAINTAGMVVFTALAASDAVEAISDNAGDTMNITVTGRSAAGDIVSETKALNGTTVISLSTLGTIERVLKIVLASSATGTVTVRRDSGGATIIAIPAGITSVRRLFYDAASEASQTVRYEKIFLKNTNGTSSLTNATIQATADPATTIEIGAAPSKDDSATATNRKTAPATVSFVDTTTQAVPGDVLGAGVAIGVWVKMTRAADAAAIKNTFTVQLAGTST